MDRCRHRNLVVIHKSPERLRCRHCHLTLTKEELTSGYCPECFETTGRRRGDFEDVLLAEGRHRRYSCEDCGAMLNPILIKRDDFGGQMKAIPVVFNEAKDDISIGDSAQAEPWDAVCERYDNDVHRIRDVRDHSPYTGLFVCYDEDNQPSHYLVEEDRELDRMRHKEFLNKLGR